METLQTRQQRVMSPERLKTTLALFMTAMLLGGALLCFALVGHLTPPILEDLSLKARSSARELSQALENGAAPSMTAQVLAAFPANRDVTAIAVLDGEGHPLSVQGEPPAPLPELFAGEPGRTRALRDHLVVWNPAKIKGQMAGKVAVVVSRERLVEGERLRRTILAIAGAWCVVAVVFSLVFVALYLGPVIRITNEAMHDLQEANGTLEARVNARTSELTQSNHKLAESLEQLRETQARLVDASRRMGMADVATAVLHNVGNVLNSVNVSATVVGERLRDHKGNRLGKIVDLIEQNRDQLAAFFTRDSRGLKLPEYLRRLVELGEKDNADIEQELELLRKNVEHIKVIVATQQSHAKGGGVVEPCDLGELLADTLRGSSDTFTRHSVQVTCELAELPLVSLDRHKTFQILMNLLTNARHAVLNNYQSDHRVSVRAFAEEEMIVIEVADNGYGIAVENLDRIFNLGFTTKQDGHGFGLHSSANAAREMRGDLTARSDGPGHGATFTLRLPLIAVERLEKVA